MDIEWDTRPAPSQYRQDWHEHGAMSSAQTTPTHSSLSQRRRSSAAHGRPAAPPPNLPIPSVPSSPPSRQPLNSPPSAFEVGEDGSLHGSHINGRGGYNSNSYTRPAPSANLSAVAAFSQSRQVLNGASNPQIETGSAFTTHDDLSDPPPQSFLPPPPSQPEMASTSTAQSRRREQEIPSEDLLQPTAAHRSDRRSENRQPSSRRALTRALELAREAVQLDSTNDNPEAAVQAYAQSVALLSEVMERVRRGDESTMDSRRRRRRSVAAQEDEIRRLQNIHDTYADRMNILSIIYSIPAVPYPAAPVPDSNTSPTASNSPSSEGSPRVPQAGPYYTHEDPGRDGAEGPDTGSIYLLDEQVLSRSTNPQNTSAGQHPYAAQYESGQSISPGAAQSRASTLMRRGRALSNLPPAPPPPSDTLPPAPVVIEPVREQTRNPTRSESNKIRPPPVETRARRISNSQLGSLREEMDDPEACETRERSTSTLDPSRSRRVSPPLPPLPSPPPTTGSSAPNTPRGSTFNTKAPPSPRLAAITASRPRGVSQLTTRSEFANQSTHGYAGAAPIPVPGLPPQRRTTKISGPSTRSASPADSTTSAGSVPKPSNPPHSRTRSSSQPGRRPSLGGGRVSPPPLPNGAAANGIMRKASFPSKALPSALPPLHLDPSNPNLHPGSLFSPHLPTTPTSPLPPLPPSDPMLKPYHMMNLLRNTIISPTGGFITRRLHVPCEVWSQGGAKLTNVAEKVRVVDILCAALEDLQISSGEHFGPGNVNNGMALGIGSIGRKEAEAWLGKLDEFSNICDGVVANFGKKLGVGEGFVLKKTTWSNKFTRRLDKFTNGKNLDSPASYVQGLNKLFGHSQLLDEHSRALLSHPMAPAYTAFPHDIRGLVDQRLKRSSEFFATVVLTFVIRDLSQLLDKYVKKCEKWLAE